MTPDIEKLKYPIGKFQRPQDLDESMIKQWIGIIKEFPDKIETEVRELTGKELEKRYRPDGWTIAQVVNHCADSHMNSFMRFKLALTEDKPTIKPYFENLWAELPDAKNYPIESSLKILQGLHKRWVNLMENLTETDLEKEFIHPESKKSISLKMNIGIYAWHCEHHLAHIINAKRDV